MMWFAEPRQPEPARRREPAFWRQLLFVAAITAVVAATRPWIQVAFVSLFGDVAGPPAWQESTAGFTCLCTSALIAVMALVETQTRSAREAVRPASLLLATIMTLALVLHLLRGPGTIRGVTATWSMALYVGSAAAFALLAACASRFAAMKTGRGKQTP